MSECTIFFLKASGDKWNVPEDYHSWQWCRMKSLEIGTFYKVRLIAPVDYQRSCMWSLYSLEKNTGTGKLDKEAKMESFFTKLFAWVRQRKLHFAMTKRNNPHFIFSEDIILTVHSFSTLSRDRFLPKFCDLGSKESVYSEMYSVSWAHDTTISKAETEHMLCNSQWSKSFAYIRANLSFT